MSPMPSPNENAHVSTILLPGTPTNTLKSPGQGLVRPDYKRAPIHTSASSNRRQQRLYFIISITQTPTQGPPWTAEDAALIPAERGRARNPRLCSETPLAGPVRSAPMPSPRLRVGPMITLLSPGGSASCRWHCAAGVQAQEVHSTVALCRHDSRNAHLGTFAWIFFACLDFTVCFDCSLQILFALSWSATNLVKLQRSRTLLPLGIGAVVHGCIGLYITIASARGIQGVVNNRSYCNLWIDPSEDPLTEGVERCQVWKAKFDILLWALLISVLVVR
jgi:hypothetical protein